MILLAALCGTGVLAWLALLALVVGSDAHWLTELLRRHRRAVFVVRHLDKPERPAEDD